MTVQPELFRCRIDQHDAPKFTPNPIKEMVRASDPSTSRKAAEKVVGKEQERRNVILDAFKTEGHMTHPELITFIWSRGHQWKESSIRGVCSRMVRDGLVKDTLERKNGFIVWGKA